MTLTPGSTYQRTDIHAHYGGRLQGRISPSSKTPTVLLFADPGSDSLDDEGMILFYGEGQLGDQRMVQGNKSVLTHKENARQLLLFMAGPDGAFTFLGEHELVRTYEVDGLNERGEPRSVFVFRLKPLSPLPKNVRLPRAPVTPSEKTRIEQTRFEPLGDSLVDQYGEHLRREGHDVSQLWIVPAGELSTLRCPLWDTTAQEIVEFAASTTRDAAYQAAARLNDYARFVKHNRTVVFAQRPRPDLVAFLASQMVRVVYAEGTTWTRALAPAISPTAL
jgi:hypothetical protein